MIEYSCPTCNLDLCDRSYTQEVVYCPRCDQAIIHPKATVDPLPAGPPPIRAYISLEESPYLYLPVAIVVWLLAWFVIIVFIAGQLRQAGVY